MKPVCECKNERRIVENKEMKKKWIERQNYLKSLKKETYLQLSGYSKLVCGKKPEDVHCLLHPEQPELVVSAITMQTPYATPTPSRTAFGNLNYVPDIESAVESAESQIKIEKDEFNSKSFKSLQSVKYKNFSEKKKSQNYDQKSFRSKKLVKQNDKTKNLKDGSFDFDEGNTNDNIKMYEDEKNQVIIQDKQQDKTSKIQENSAKLESQSMTALEPSKFFSKLNAINAQFDEQEALLQKKIKVELEIFKKFYS